MDVTLTINGYDAHKRLSTYNVTEEVTYRKVITALDDTEYPYPAKNRPIITFSMWPLTDEESAKLYNALSGLTFTATFTNQHKNQDETRRVRVVSNLESAFALKSVDGKRRYKGGEIQLRGL
jgi:hypothetical protein